MVSSVARSLGTVAQLWEGEGERERERGKGEKEREGGWRWGETEEERKGRRGKKRERGKEIFVKKINSVLHSMCQFGCYLLNKGIFTTTII